MRLLLAGFLAATLLAVSSAPVPGKDEKSPDVQALMKQLQDADVIVRLKAAKTLGKLGKKAKDAVPALTTALNDKDTDVRSIAKNALDAIKADGGVPKNSNAKLDEIVKDLKSKTASTRIKAAGKLGDLGAEGKPAARTLVEVMLETYPRNREPFLEALEKIDPESQKLILSLLSETQADRMIDSIDGMEGLAANGQACLPVLLMYFSRDRSGKLTPGFSLAQRILPALVKIAPDDKAVAQAVHSSLSVQAKLFDSALRLKAIEVCKDLKSDPKLTTKALLSALNDPLCRLQAIEALGAMGPEAMEALPVLMKLKLDVNKEVREVAAAAVEKIKERKDTKDKDKDTKDKDKDKE